MISRYALPLTYSPQMQMFETRRCHLPREGGARPRELRFVFLLPHHGLTPDHFLATWYTPPSGGSGLDEELVAEYIHLWGKGSLSSCPPSPWPITHIP